MNQSEELGGAVTFQASRTRSNITRVDIRVDGGISVFYQLMLSNSKEIAD